MRRLPAAAFASLVVATVGAFFVTQHLKVTTPLIAGFPRPFPQSFNPIDGRRCRVITPDGTRQFVSFRRMQISFYLLHRSDDVGVYIVNSDGEVVATLASNRHMRVRVRYPDGLFSWNGREDSGEVAPDGTYFVRIALQQQGRTIELTDKPLRIITVPPHPRVTGVDVTGSTAPPRGPALLSPPSGSVTIHYLKSPYRSAFVQIYRTDIPGKPQIVKSFQVPGRRGSAVWDGLIKERPAPPGTYLVGMFASDAACNPGRFPIVDPPPPGSTPHTGVAVRYLAAQPPLTPVTAGHTATVFVDSRRHAYTWALYRVGERKPAAHGRGSSVTLQVPMPPRGAGLYELWIHSAGQRTAVPLIASAGGRRAAAPIMVVLPALTWQGENPVDDNGDGLPDTLAAGDSVSLSRPLAAGLPRELAAEAALLKYLDKMHLAYQLTSDVALAGGAQPVLKGHRGIVLDGSERWLPATLGPILRSFVQNGGHVLSIGTDSMLSTSALKGTAAARPGPRAQADPFGAKPGKPVTGSRELVTVFSDGLGIFTNSSGVFTGFSAFQPITPPSSTGLSLAGTAAGSPSVVGFPTGRGSVVEIGLQGFTAKLAHDVDAQELIASLWHMLSR